MTTSSQKDNESKVEHSDAEPEVYYANFILPEAWEP